MSTYLGILDDEMSWGQDERDQGGGEEHLNDCNVAVIATEYLGEGIGVIYAEAF